MAACPRDCVLCKQSLPDGQFQGTSACCKTCGRFRRRMYEQMHRDGDILEWYRALPLSKRRFVFRCFRENQIMQVPIAFDFHSLAIDMGYSVGAPEVACPDSVEAPAVACLEDMPQPEPEPQPQPQPDGEPESSSSSSFDVEYVCVVRIKRPKH